MKSVLKPWGLVVGHNSTDYIGNNCSFIMFLSNELLLTLRRIF